MCGADIPFDKLTAGFVRQVRSHNSCVSDTFVPPTFTRLQRLRLVPKLPHRLILPSPGADSSLRGCPALLAFCESVGILTSGASFATPSIRAKIE